MNYIGHLLLSYPHAEITMGNLIGDMVRNAQLKYLPARVIDGVMVHRAIDHYTDRHPLVRKAVALFRDRHGKYAPVVLDILIDHILCREWSAYSGMSFEDFTRWVYRTVQDHASELPSDVDRRVSAMAANHWLDQYTSLDGLEVVLHRMDYRARFPSHFGEAIVDLELYYPVLSGWLTGFYPEARAHVAALIAEITPRNAD